MPARVELHFHLLPAVDDGPVDMDVALELARMAVADGTDTVVATPHVRDAALHEIAPRTAELTAALREAGVPLRVLPGAELAWDDLPSVGEGALELIAQGPPGGRWLLLETPLQPGCGRDFLRAAAQLRGRGYDLLVAYPERTPALWAGEALLLGEDLEDAVALQVNASSLLGEHGEDARARGLALVRSGRATVVASDAHRPTRGPRLGPAVEALRGAGVPAGVAERLVSTAPRALLERGVPAALPRAA